MILPICQCESARLYVEYDQQHRLLQFLMGLNESYTSIRSQILMMSPLPSVGQAFSIISQEESHRSISSDAVYPVDASASAFFSSQDRFDDRRRSSIKCEYCKVPGHTKSVCYKLVGYPPHHKLYKSTFDKGNIFHSRNVRASGSANMTTLESHDNVGSESHDKAGVAQGNVSGSLFTPAQYAEAAEQRFYPSL